MTNSRLAFMFVIGTLGLLTTAALGEDIKLSRVPVSVKKAADKVLPKTQWKTAKRERRRDTSRSLMYYKLAGTASDRRNVMVEVAAGGTVIEYMTQVPSSKVPKNVTKSLEDTISKSLTVSFKPTMVMMVHRDGKPAGYRLFGIYQSHTEGTEKGRMTAFVSANTKRITVDIPGKAGISRTVSD